MTTTRPQPGTARCPDCGREVDAGADLCACGFPLMFLRPEEQSAAPLKPSRRPADDDDTDELPVVVPEPYAPVAPGPLDDGAPYEGVDLVEEIVCATCQEVNPLTRTWCARCGSALRERLVLVEEPPSAPTTARHRGRVLAVLAAVLVLVGAVVGAVLLRGGDEQPSPSPVGALEVASVEASATADDGVSPGVPVVSYAARNVLDGDPSTTWRVPGDGIGDFLTFTFAEAREVTRVGLVPGYVKVDPVDGTDRFEQNRRITSVVWVLAEGVEVAQRVPTPPAREMVTLELPEPVETTTVVLRISGSTPPGGEDVAPRDFAPISEVLLEGR